MNPTNLSSMTGYGRAEAETPLGRILVEIKSVNSRFLELTINASRELASIEHRLRNLIKAEIERGKVECRVRLTPTPERRARARVNEGVVLDYLDHLRQIRERTGLASEIDLQLLLGLPGAVDVADEEPDIEESWGNLLGVVREALARFHEERLREGTVLARHLLEEIEILRGQWRIVSDGREAVLARQRERLAARMTEIEEQLRGKFDAGRLEMELALLIDRQDVSEELVRLEAHLNRFAELVEDRGGKPAGKAMDFLIQEILREVNTVASKARELDLSQAALAMKGAVERAREQVQNIE